jgi:hypothetical protein
MNIYLKHPKHGTKVAVSELEAVADEKNGWERYEIAPKIAEIVQISAENEQEIENCNVLLADLTPKKRGRPPKHAH